MKQIIFTEMSAQYIYNQYMTLVKNSTKNLMKEDSKEILMEITNHIYEATNAKTEKSETDSLIDVLTELGDPYEFLKPIMADKMLDRAYKTFNPLIILKAILFAMGNAIGYFLFFIFFVIFTGSIFSILLKIKFPSNTGFFIHDDGGTSFGFINDLDGTKEILGPLYFPVVVIFAVLLYVLILTFFKIIKKNAPHTKTSWAK